MAIDSNNMCRCCISNLVKSMNVMRDGAFHVFVCASVPCRTKMLMKIAYKFLMKDAKMICLDEKSVANKEWMNGI